MPGRRGANRATSASASIPICSISSVTTSAPEAKRRAASTSFPAADNGFISYEVCRTAGFRIHDAHAIAHGPRGHRHHAAQLPAAENGQQASRLYHRRFGLSQGSDDFTPVTPDPESDLVLPGCVRRAMPQAVL